MGKLQEMVVEETSMGNRLKYNSRRLQLAGIGLFAKIEEEREKLYQQILQAGGNQQDDSLVGKLNTLGNGTVNFVIEESQRIFDELVEAGEQFKATGQVAEKASKPEKASAKKETKQPKAEVKPLKVKTTADSPAPEVKVQPKAKSPARQSKSVEIDLDLKSAFETAQEKVKAVTGLTKENELLMLALILQAEEGDVKGRRPAKAKVEACEIFDARRDIKGMKQAEAMNRYIEIAKELAS